MNIGQCYKRSNSWFRLVSNLLAGGTSRSQGCVHASYLVVKVRIWHLTAEKNSISETLTLVALEQPLYYKTSQILWFLRSLVSLSSLWLAKQNFCIIITSMSAPFLIPLRNHPSIVPSRIWCCPGRISFTNPLSNSYHLLDLLCAPFNGHRCIGSSCQLKLTRNVAA